MGKFINTSDGMSVLSTEIVEIRKFKREKSVIKTRDNDYYVVHESRGKLLSDVEFNSAQIIAAQPGFSVVFAFEPVDEDGEWITVCLPVVGWSAKQKEHDMPFLFESVPIVPGIHRFSTDWALVMPNGNVFSEFSYYPLSMDEWLDCVKESCGHTPKAKLAGESCSS